MRYCKLKDCQNKHKARGYCDMHLARYYRHGDTNIRTQKKLKPKLCKIEDCDRANLHLELCGRHYKRLRRHGSPYADVKDRTEHKLSHLQEYNIWKGIKSRCQNPKEKYYYNYGGRGINVCKKWSDSFLAFYEDMGERPSPKHSIDRINNDGGYEPNNCRWATRTQQNLNKRYKRSVNGYKGCYKDGNLYYCKVGCKPSVNLGSYKTPEEAAYMYDCFAIAAYGNDARTNFEYV